MSAEANREVGLRQAERAISARVLDQTVILDLSADRYTRLNGTASDLWEQLSEPRTTHELAESLVSAHGIDEGQAQRDVESCLAPLLERGLLERARPPSS